MYPYCFATVNLLSLSSGVLTFSVFILTAVVVFCECVIVLCSSLCLSEDHTMAQVGMDLWVHLVLLLCSSRDTSRWVLKIPKEKAA